MKRWLRILLWIVLVLVVIGAAGYYWFLYDSRPPGGLTPFTIDIARARSLATESTGDRAAEIRFEPIAEGSFPTTAVVAGEGWNGFPMVMASYQLVFPADTIIVDTGIGEAAAKGFGATFLADNYATMQGAMERASQILVTHEHADHIGGIIGATNPAAVAPRLSLTLEQLANAGKFAGFTVPPGVLADAEPLAYDDYYSAAPGVVLIKAPGHSPGSQLIFVTLASGKEYLFVGDIGWSFRNIEDIRGRPRLVSQFMLNEQRDTVFTQLQALHDLHAAEPGIVIVPGHDAGYLDGLVGQGLMIEGFATP